MIPAACYRGVVGGGGFQAGRQEGGEEQGWAGKGQQRSD